MKKYRIKETGVILTFDGHARYKLENTNGFSFGSFDLEALGLTIEEMKPEVKKLYAYQRDTGEVFFLPNQDARSMYGRYSRTEQYDITFEEK